MIKRGFLILMAVFFTLVLTAVFKKTPYFLESPVQNSFDFDRVVIKISGYKVMAEIADTEEKRERGLSGRKNLPEDAGMIFIFEIPAKYSFWMKDMRFPLDIIWVDKNKQVSAISKNIFPETYPASFTPSENVKYVLEVNAGWTEKNGVRVGDFIEL